MKFTKYCTLLFLCILGLNSCVEKLKFDDTTSTIVLKPALALPIGSVHANMLDLLDYVDTTYITTDSTNAVCVIYNQENIDLNLDFDKFINGETIKESISLINEESFYNILKLFPNDAMVTLPKGEYNFHVNSDYTFGFNTHKEDEIIYIDSAIISSANLNFTLQTRGLTLSESNYLLVTFHFPDFINEELTEDLKHFRITSNTFSIKAELENFKVLFDKLADNNVTRMTADYKYVSDGTATITRDADLQFDVIINTMAANEIYGFVWWKNAIVNENISFDVPQDLFNNKALKESNLLFSNPQIELSLSTNVGIPLELSIKEMYAVADEQKYTAKFEGKDDLSIILNTPEKPFNQATTTVKLDRNNGSLHTLLSVLPEQINLDYSISTPNAYSGIHNQFITRPIEAILDVDVKLPLQFDPKTNFKYKDTLDVDFASMIGEKETLNTINLDTLSIYLDINSTLPANTIVKLYYLDEEDNVLFESVEFGIQSAAVDKEGRVSQATKETLVLSANGENINSVYDTKKIILELSITGYDENSHIYFQSTDAIDIDISAFVKINPTININSLKEEYIEE